MRMVDLIAKKRDGQSLSKEEIEWIVTGYTNGKIPDYQMSALTMAIFYQDMTDQEITDLTLAMANSGDVVNLENIEGIKVDKHSTGGVGDTTTLVLAPLVASVGVPVAKMSGRGLGYTGGTLDKLEAIPGFQIELSEDKFVELVNESKVAVIGQSGNLAPADKKLYALRDVTATVDSIPLIASSIMSKKIAAGADAIVLDVTTGDGAFMKNLEDAKRLASTMVQIGKLANRQTMAVISDMSQPLGEAIGNSLEVVEAIETLQGKGPKDLEEMCYVLGSQMVVLAKKADTLEQAREMLEEALHSGKAFAKFKEMVANQGGDVSVIDHPEKLLTAKYEIELPAKQSGVITKLVANELGIAAMMLGAGRKTKEDTIDFAVGLKLRKKVGEAIQEGESVLTIYANQPAEEIQDVVALLYQNIEIGPSGQEPPLIHGIITE
ncbi:pyrimidine-nucleoside phosphorylase [Enterococcus cecorum]|uniref:Pyrimidine-nucleoside phosphorylase n=1 Tax=Enterococcus cecorum DSM 20682 = ATCC 43198 TaxID=1121864 RepID=S1R2H9_9ENTE|nr:pyrimidine-nucleoside phosphorylase [Enterococcus cecorum]EOX19488.1 pyrimidine-nucleoside phosphorylase [Enterococcus cecorum DSM 20682 = ATCC 43198]ESK60745.1 pyrimidine-nucleoside phosphorylase [Enterococcus cecorum DSM 20682 = ATCC 43198]OJG31712.1 pyrimidine-nucleoside phosphorylase [Enterococcus cecorum DSM 20682 = ATCC 43198]CAI3478447.1 pyrimidine-nucleoside phosphorylase [Enterococcus cecorum DSM 20682 = ATCC 43198]SQE53956.1 pyrimidine-nucleoside phosphorylase [Enterococcus cecoru